MLIGAQALLSLAPKGISLSRLIRASIATSRCSGASAPGWLW